MANGIQNMLESGEAEFQGQSRRLLIYSLLDVSGSMIGAPIEAVNDGVDLLIRSLKDSPEAVELVNLCFITFGSVAELLVPLTPLIQIERGPKISAGGGTNMTAAIEMVNDQIDKDFQPSHKGKARGDYKPLIFMFTDGKPHSLAGAVAAAQRLHNRPSGYKIGTFMALGCGQDADRDNLEQITRPVAMMTHMTKENIKEFFVWMSATVKGASQRASQAVGDTESLQMAPPPPPKDPDGVPIFSF